MPDTTDRQIGELGYRAPRPWLPIVLVAVALIVTARELRKTVGCAGPPQHPRETTAPAAHAGPAGPVQPVPAAEIGRGVVPIQPAGQPPAVPAPAASPQAVSWMRLLADARAAEEARNWGAARRRYLDCLALDLPPNARAEIEERLGRINLGMLLSNAAMPEKVEHVVSGGESLEIIARKYGTTAELLQKMNGLSDPNVVRKGQRLSVLNGKLAIAVHLASNELLLTLNGAFFKKYKVGTGLPGKTPKGAFVISTKEKEPAWWRPSGKPIPYGHPDNILGTRWMSIKAAAGTPDVQGYGIHGTWEEDSIGKHVSAGCIRMTNRDVEELFMLVTAGTPVTVAD